jgi:small GTP-binding protein
LIKINGNPIKIFHDQPTFIRSNKVKIFFIGRRRFLYFIYLKGVGKNQFQEVFCRFGFIEEYYCDMGADYEKTINFQGKEVNIVFFKNIEQEYASILDHSLKKADGFILMYDVTNKSTFDSLEKFYNIIQRSLDCDSFPLIVVGNKIDLKGERIVSGDAGKEFADKLECPFFEMSVKLRVNVDEVVYELVGQVLNPRNQKIESKDVKIIGESNKKECLLM